MIARLLAFSIALVPAALAVAPESADAGESDDGANYWSHPRIRSCCSEADAVYADEWRLQPDGSVIAKVTGGTSRTAEWAPVGKVYLVPAYKVVDVPNNPTGRPLLFLSRTLVLYCFALGPLT
jgi:hypothetical protein